MTPLTIRSSSWGWTPGNPYICNDDYWFEAPCYTYSSFVGRVPVQVGHTYYIVIDGYGGQFGAYSMDVTEAETPQPVVCPAGARIEGEPPCVDGYVDLYNNGCGGTRPVWSSINAQAAGCAVMCGKSCTFGSFDRDTDWFESMGAGTLVTATCTAEFPLQFLLIYGADCAALDYVIGTGDPSVPVTRTWTVGAGEAVWFWVGNQDFWGWPESNYVLDICGIQDPPPPPGACCSAAGACIVSGSSPPAITSLVTTR